MHNFEGGTKTTSRELVERASHVHSFETFLYTVFALSKTELEPQGGEPCVRSTRMRGILLRSATQAKWHK